MKSRKVTAYKCTKCGARPGQRCMTLGIPQRALKVPHTARIARAAEAAGIAVEYHDIAL
jgi:hypothetical protein